MSNDEYDELVNSVIEHESPLKNISIAFLSGGIIGVIAELISNIFINTFNMNISDGYLCTTILFIVVGSILTGLGFFDKLLSICKCGLIVPTTGFANTMTSSAMDTRCEGFVKGIGSSMFKLTGSIILYGIVFGIIFGFIRSLIL
jgi:stage V sporulation protein AC